VTQALAMYLVHLSLYRTQHKLHIRENVSSGFGATSLIKSCTVWYPSWYTTTQTDPQSEIQRCQDLITCWKGHYPIMYVSANRVLRLSVVYFMIML